ncbi:MAG: tRNA uridine-5-carboxymethylaminomethyl(34) synthesis GTPase MnmE [Eubacteriales bacterium]
MSASSTIAAISTPQAAGGIGIVRISGADAIKVTENVFKASNGRLLSQSEGYRAYYGKVWDNSVAVDEAVCLVFRAPHSFTGEDTAEISCHGGLYIMQRVLQAVLRAGANPAEPGEFTKRAFLNGKIELSDAEAVMSLICAQGEQAAQAALTALEGALSKKIHKCAEKLIYCAAQIAAWVDYPDEDIEEISLKNLIELFVITKMTLEELLSRFNTGRAVSEGVETVIVGRPNVGKSTLMNLLTGFERSIVTEYAGTTRDVVEETVRLGDLILHLADTAGLRNTDNPVESIGVERALKKLRRADLVLAVFDGSDRLTHEDKNLLENCKDKLTIAVINKTDLPRALDLEYINSIAADTVEISAASGEGLDSLSIAVARLLGTDKFDPSAAMLANERQRACCKKALEWIEKALTAAKDGQTMDAINVCIDSAIEALLELTGEKASEAVVNAVFSSFCVGK